VSAGPVRGGEGGGPGAPGDPLWARPRLVASACLEGEACRYNGQSVRARFLLRLEPHVELVRVCPEVGIGLGVPRAPIRLVSLGGAPGLVQPGTGRDVTEAMEDFAGAWLGGVGEVDGFLLKARSPTCGPKDVKVYSGDGVPRNERVPGLFAAAVAARFPLVALEDEGRLTNYRLRHHFLTRLFQSARLRALPASPAALMAFHASNKLLLLAHAEPGMRALGRLLAAPGGPDGAGLKARYAEGFARALAEPPRTGGIINALQHAAGHFSKVLLPAEKRLFLVTLSDLKTGRGSLEAPRALLRGWVARYGVAWLEGQTLFEPYPAELHDLADSAGAARAA
jgi:uncharacterized protein YbbK (DUF523 family)/uncharacterized protein YbgA (DUF1722 family)